MNMFEAASRYQYRFATSAGMLSAEDLWGLPLTSKTNRANLDDTARTIFNELKDQDQTVSFVSDNSVISTKKQTLETKLEIVKHIIAERLAEKKANDEAKDRADRRQKLLTLIEEKKDKALSETSLEELQKMVAEL